MEDIRIRCNPMMDLSKFTSNKIKKKRIRLQFKATTNFESKFFPKNITKSQFKKIVRMNFD